jgi:hypothetical protein
VIINWVAVGAVVLLVLAGLSLSRGRGHHRRGRSRGRRHGGFSKKMVYVLLPRKEKPAERNARLLRQANAYFKANPGATKMPLDLPAPRSVRGRAWDRLVVWAKKKSHGKSPF